MAKIPVMDDLKHSLDYPLIEEVPRHYLGMSMIGSTCDRSLQLYFRWGDTTKLTRRIRRLFDFGHIAEEQMTKEFERIGCHIYGQQEEYVGFAGHWQGHSDGKITNVPGKEDKRFLLEYKSHNAKWFKLLQKDGVQKGFPKHYDQAQRYLKEEPELDGIMYVGYSKNDSDYYIEFIERDEVRALELKSREQHIMLLDTLAPKIGNGLINWFECKMCDLRYVCHEKKPVMKSCRSCLHIQVEDGGKFSCLKLNKVLTLQEQIDGCDSYQLDEYFFDRAAEVSAEGSD